jgi:hypothetical protein
MYYPDSSPAKGYIPLAKTLPSTEFCHKFLQAPTEKGPPSWKRAEKLAIIKASWQVL